MITFKKKSPVILYLHGFKSHPGDSIENILSQQDDYNITSIFLDPLKPEQTYKDVIKASRDVDLVIGFSKGVYFGNQSKSISRDTVIGRFKNNKQRRSEGKEVVSKDWDDPGTLITVKIPMKDYNKMKKLESDPMSKFNNHKFYYNNYGRYKMEYDSKGPIGKLIQKGNVKLRGKHFEKDVVLIQEKVDPKYITKIDNKWY